MTRYRFLCNECGRKIVRAIGPRTYEIQCPKCGGYDVEPDGIFIPVRERTTVSG